MESAAFIAIGLRVSVAPVGIANASGATQRGAMRANARRSQNRLAHAADIGRLQVSQAAVNGLEMIERCRGAEIAAIDQRNGQTALRRVVGDRQTVDAAAHHEHVEFAFGEAREISNQAGLIL